MTEAILLEIADIIGDIVGEFNSGGNIPDIAKVCPNEMLKISSIITAYTMAQDYEARIDEVQNAYNLIQSYLIDDDMDSDNAVEQLQIVLRSRRAWLAGLLKSSQTKGEGTEV